VTNLVLRRDRGSPVVAQGTRARARSMHGIEQDLSLHRAQSVLSPAARRVTAAGARPVGGQHCVRSRLRAGAEAARPPTAAASSSPQERGVTDAAGDRVLARRKAEVWHGARRGASVATCAVVARCVCARTRVHARARAVARARDGDARPHKARRRRGDQEVKSETSRSARCSSRPCHARAALAADAAAAQARARARTRRGVRGGVAPARRARRRAQRA
jgi:hypothetical protein